MGMILGWIFIAIGLIVFFALLIKPLRNEIPPLEHSVKNSKVVWGLWFTGDKITEKGLVEKYHSIKRILLLDPKSDAFKRHLEKSIDTEERAGRQIRQLTKQAQENNLEVRWYFKEQESGITLYDSQEGNEPSSDKAWCVFEKHDVHVLREDRPRTISKNIKEGRKEYEILLNKYKEIWGDKYSREPKHEEYSP